MTQYLIQTNPSLLVEGELSVTGNQLIVGTGGGSNEVVGAVANTTAVSSLTTSYAEELMDISSAQTLGSNFIFLNGTSFDAMGVGNYEFEEANGIVYGLYGRTDGISQQVYFSGALNNQQGLQYTTVPYVPPFLSGSAWQASSVAGSDLQGFILTLRDTTAGSTASPRYLYVKHNGSLINTAGHTYVEVTSVVNAYIASGTELTGVLPKIVRVGAYFFIALPSWQEGLLRFGGWNAQDATYPQISTALPASPIAYSPQTFTITTSGWPGGDQSALQFPILAGLNAPGGLANYRIYNSANGAVTVPALISAPNPIPAGWAANSACRLEGEDNGSGTPLMALGFSFYVVDSAGLVAGGQITFTFNVTFTAGSAGAYTAALITYVTAGTLGSDLNHCQPYPFLLSTTASAPNEAVASNAATPSTCVNKLPISTWYDGFPSVGYRTPFTNWYYSGYLSTGGSSSAQIQRGIAKGGTNLGGLAAAQLNKRAMLYPMWNVNPRVDFSPSGNQFSNSFVQPSGKIAQVFFGHLVGQDLILSVSESPQFANQWTMSQMPANSQITDASYNRAGTLIPGMKPRVAEYLVNLPNPNSTLSTWGCVWPTGLANINAPVNFNFPSMSTSGLKSANNAQVRVGSWTLSGGVYQPPPVLWTYSATMDAQLAALRTSVVAAVTAAYPSSVTTGVYGIDVVPIMNSAGTGIAFALGILHSGGPDAGTGQNLYQTAFITPCTVSGSTINLSNTSSVTLLRQGTSDTTGMLGTYTATDVNYGRLFIVYGQSGGGFYVGWSNPNTINVVGDTVATVQFYQFNSANGLVAGNSTGRSVVRSYLACSAQHQGMVICPYRDGVSIPDPDLPISRYATSTVATLTDFAASFNAAIANPDNFVSGTTTSASNNLAELMTLQAISNTFLLQIGSINGRLNHKEYSLPSSFIDMTSYAAGTYYLYLTDTGTGGVVLQVDAAQRAESTTNTYFGKFDRTSSGFANESSISEMIRFGTSRLVSGTAGTAMQGSQIRIGPYVG